MPSGTQVDFVGDIPRAPFSDIANTRQSNAEEKAMLALELHSLLLKCPQAVANGGIKAVQRWREEHAECKKVAASQRSSVHQLRSAIAKMGAWFQ